VSFDELDLADCPGWTCDGDTEVTPIGRTIVATIDLAPVTDVVQAVAEPQQSPLQAWKM